MHKQNGQNENPNGNGQKVDAFSVDYSIHSKKETKQRECAKRGKGLKFSFVIVAFSTLVNGESCYLLQRTGTCSIQHTHSRI